jgi:methionyl-tRNA formyltransferase
MKKYILVSNKEWQIDYLKKILINTDAEWCFISNCTDFNIEKIVAINPEKIFISHWSHKITEDIYNRFECILFHMTDLPYGRGGSPLQNLIVRGHTDTMISAIKVEKGLDAGDVYLKAPLSLEGAAEEIFIRASSVIQQMIEKIIKLNIIPEKQDGEVVIFKRRKPEDGNLAKVETLKLFYDYIRMLDADGYPNAFIETDYFKIEFNNANLTNDNTIISNVRITKK